MNEDTRLWLIRHAPVAGAEGVIHGDDAPAATSDTAKFATLRARLPDDAASFASPAIRTLATAAALGLRPTAEANFREQDFGDWTGRRHDDLAREPGAAYRDFWNAPASSKPPGGESFAEVVIVLMDAENRGGVHAIGFYDDELVRADDGWRIARRRFTMVRMSALAAR